MTKAPLPGPGHIATIVLALSIGALGSCSRPAAPATTPTLLVVLVVDQMRADYIAWYGHQWTAGLRRLLDEGAWFTQAAYPYRTTVTCAGHATIATGRFPAAHGMVQNQWWDRGSAQQVSCTADTTVEPISYGGRAHERHSPDTLMQATLSDLLREQSPDAPRIVALSVKPRTAVTLAGQAGDAVVWFDASGTWATSTAYAETPVPAVRQFVADHPVESALDRVWTRLLPVDSYLHGDRGSGERPGRGWSSTFPHPLDDGTGIADGAFYDRWRSSPFSDEYLVDMGIALVDALGMGSTTTTDYLALGLSGLDIVGHSFGPESHEVQDVLARLDVGLGRLLDELDQRLGPDRYVVALSSDHGVSLIPEVAVARGLDSGRVQTSELARSIDSHLVSLVGDGSYVSAFINGDLYFAPGVYAMLLDQPDLLNSVLELIRSTAGVARVYLSEDLSGAPDESDAVRRAAQLSYIEGRSGDLTVVLKPNWIGSGLGATHGSPYPYDTHVPVVLYGAGIVTGQHATMVTPADIAPTLASLAGIDMPETDGRVLTDAIRRR